MCVGATCIHVCINVDVFPVVMLCVLAVIRCPVIADTIAAGNFPPSHRAKPLSGQRVTWQVDRLVSQEQAPGDTSTIPGSREGQDLTQSSHVVLEGSRADVTHS